MDKLASMRVFVRVAELASFTRAAESLGTPKASISTSIQQLEGLMGTQLLHRTTRKVQLTQDGQIFYERCKDVLSDMEEVEGMFQSNPTNLTGRIRVDMPSRFAKNVIVPRLSEFTNKHPRLEVELSCTDRRVDIIREGFDCVLRVGNLADSGLMAKNLGALKIVNCVSPAYIKKHGHPKKLEDLASHHLIHYVMTLGAKSEGFEYFDGEKYRFVKMKGPITVNNSDAYMAACLSGFGIAQVPEMGVRDLLKKGALVEVMSKFSSEPMPVSLVYPHRRNLARRVQVFMEWMSEVVKDYVE